MSSVVTRGTTRHEQMFTPLRKLQAAAPLRSDNPGPVPFGIGQGDLVFSPDGRMLASVSGSDQVTLWDVTRPARATRIATLAGPRDHFAALAFSPRGNLLAGVTYHGSVLVFRVAGPGRPARVSTHPGILASARFPDGGDAPASPCGPGPGCGVPAAYAAGFTPSARSWRRVTAGSRPHAALRDFCPFLAGVLALTLLIDVPGSPARTGPGDVTLGPSRETEIRRNAVDTYVRVEAACGGVLPTMPMLSDVVIASENRSQQQVLIDRSTRVERRCAQPTPADVTIAGTAGGTA